MSKFQIVPHSSRLSLEGQSSMHPIESSTTRLEGYLEAEMLDDRQLDLTTPPTGRFEIAVEDLKAGNDLYDLEMKRRLDTRRYPTIVAELLELRPLNQGNRYHAVGNLSFHGVTRRLEGEVTITPVDERTLEIGGEQTFDVRDFNVTPPKLLMLKVYPEIKVSLKAVVKRTG